MALFCCPLRLQHAFRRNLLSALHLKRLLLSSSLCLFRSSQFCLSLRGSFHRLLHFCKRSVRWCLRQAMIKVVTLLLQFLSGARALVALSFQLYLDILHLLVLRQGFLKLRPYHFLGSTLSSQSSLLLLQFVVFLLHLLQFQLRLSCSRLSGCSHGRFLSCDATLFHELFSDVLQLLNTRRLRCRSNLLDFLLTSSLVLLLLALCSGLSGLLQLTFQVAHPFRQFSCCCRSLQSICILHILKETLLKRCQLVCIHVADLASGSSSTALTDGPTAITAAPTASEPSRRLLRSQLLG
mmetsp:Transcript_29386/g.77669  ORF Transcript_29386/g.77669 Transcript_29386/m.77669 type:complete len:295 (+) Transcript_29386:2336-3220(+)